MVFSCLNFFSNFLGILYPGTGKDGIRNEFFFLFLGLSLPGFDRNIAEMMFLKFFAIFLGIPYFGSGRNGIRSENIFFSISAYLSTVWIEIFPE